MTKHLQKLELTWIGKGNEPHLEPRILLEDTSKSYGDPKAENMLINGDNLLALKALEQNFSGRIKCIYIDPPYNTGQAFEHYDDGIEHSIWLSLMRDRFNIIRNLLKPEGVFLCQVNDDEMAYGKVLLDEIYGRDNFLNTVSVKMKQTSGASGGGEDKRLKKNIEYILIYSRDKENFQQFNDVYDEEDLFELINQMRDEGKSWKYTRVIFGLNEREFLKEVVDGSGQPIKIFKHSKVFFKTIPELMQEDKLTEEECYVKYFDKVFRDTNAQSSIRTRVMEATVGDGDFFSIDYVPRSGKNKNQLTTLYYKGNNRDLIAWLKDVCVKRGSRLVKYEKAGTFWEGFPLNNLTKEGNVKFPNGKKPEALLQKIFDLTTVEGDYVLDSFLGSGTTAAVAHKMNRKWIGIELGEHANTHCLPRLKSVIDGEQSGISKFANWKGGGGFKFYNLAPSLIQKDKYGNDIINPAFNPNMLAAAMAKQEGFRYAPHESIYWKQGNSSEKDFIFTTTQFITVEMLDRLAEEMQPLESLLICCKGFSAACKSRRSNITIKKIPQMLFGRCEFGKDDYSLNIVNLPHDEAQDTSEENISEPPIIKSKKGKTEENQPGLF